MEILYNSVNKKWYDMYPKTANRVHVPPNMYPKTANRVHIQFNTIINRNAIQLFGNSEQLPSFLIPHCFSIPISYLLIP